MKRISRYELRFVLGMLAITVMWGWYLLYYRRMRKNFGNMTLAKRILLHYTDKKTAFWNQAPALEMWIPEPSDKDIQVAAQSVHIDPHAAILHVRPLLSRLPEIPMTQEGVEMLEEFGFEVRKLRKLSMPMLKPNPGSGININSVDAIGFGSCNICIGYTSKVPAENDEEWAVYGKKDSLRLQIIQRGGETSFSLYASSEAKMENGQLKPILTQSTIEKLDELWRDWGMPESKLCIIGKPFREPVNGELVGECISGMDATMNMLLTGMLLPMNWSRRKRRPASLKAN